MDLISDFDTTEEIKDVNDLSICLVLVFLIYWLSILYTSDSDLDHLESQIQLDTDNLPPSTNTSANTEPTDVEINVLLEMLARAKIVQSEALKGAMMLTATKLELLQLLDDNVELRNTIRSQLKELHTEKLNVERMKIVTELKENQTKVNEQAAKLKWKIHDANVNLKEMKEMEEAAGSKAKQIEMKIQKLRNEF